MIRVLAIAALLWASEPGALAAESPPPNIVWIIADDMSPDIAAYGAPGVKTPHLDRLAAVVFEFGEQSEFLGRREAVARRVRNHRHTLALANPTDCVAQRSPAVRHKTGFALGQKTSEHFVGVLAHAGLHQKTGEVGAGNQIGIARVGECAFKTAVYADLGQPGGHVLGAIMPAATCALQTGQQARVIDVKTQTNDMYRVTGK